MKKKISTILMVLMSCAIFAQSNELSDDELFAIYEKFKDSVENALHYEYGIVNLENDLATITVPVGFKFLNSEQSNYVLTDLWENPPSEVLGLLFPEDTTPLSDNFSYAVEVTYSDEGYIADEDAEDIDYEELLDEMKADTDSENEFREENGYEPIELIGWASSPYYDAASKKLHWAKEIKFGESDIHTLNYNIRVLGRQGYLNLNAIGDMDALSQINYDLDAILTSVEFTEGNRYADFDASIDNVAAYGIGGLVAGKLLAKAGLFAGLLKFWKVIALGAIGAFGIFRKKFFNKEE